MIKAIFFDLGGVLLKEPIETYIKIFSEASAVKVSDFEKLLREHEKDILTGKMSEKDFENIMKRKFNSNKNFVKTWENTYKAHLEVNEEVLELAKTLQKQYVVGIISNIFALHAQVLKDSGLLPAFKPEILSCDVGFYKPQKKIFEIALEKAKLNATECVFIDDRVDNLETPNNIGFHTVYYKGIKDLTTRLRELGLRF